MILGIACANCGRDPGPAEARLQLTRQYRLVLNSRTVDPQLDSSDLVLRADGTFVQRCRFKDRPREEVAGTWSFSPPRNVFFSRFRDCARVFGDFPPDGGASLIVEFSNPPVIVLSPDIVGVFYEGLR
jgi:hypothetical protein